MSYSLNKYLKAWYGIGHLFQFEAFRKILLFNFAVIQSYLNAHCGIRSRKYSGLGRAFQFYNSLIASKWCYYIFKFSQLRHPNIVLLLGITRPMLHNQVPSIILEQISSGCLHTVLMNKVKSRFAYIRLYIKYHTILQIP